MPFKKLPKPTQMLLVLWFAMMGLLSLCSCGTVEIKDEQICTLLPGKNGAICDNFLTQNQIILTEDQWQAKREEWQKQGLATIAINAQAIADFKEEVEKLCSVAKCKSADKKMLLEVLGRITENAKKAMQ